MLMMEWLLQNSTCKCIFGIRIFLREMHYHKLENDLQCNENQSPGSYCHVIWHEIQQHVLYISGPSIFMAKKVGE